MQAEFKPWSFPNHGTDKPGHLRDVKEILRRRHTTGRRTSGKKIYAGEYVAESDLCERAKLLVNKGLHVKIEKDSDSMFSEEVLQVKQEKLVQEINAMEKPDRKKPPANDSSDSDDDLPLCQRKGLKVRSPAARVAAA